MNGIVAVDEPGKTTIVTCVTKWEKTGLSASVETWHEGRATSGLDGYRSHFFTDVLAVRELFAPTNRTVSMLMPEPAADTPTKGGSDDDPQPA